MAHRVACRRRLRLQCGLSQPSRDKRAREARRIKRKTAQHTACRGRHRAIHLRLRRRVGNRTARRRDTPKKRNPRERPSQGTRRRRLRHNRKLRRPRRPQKIAASFKRKRGPQYQNLCKWIGTNTLDLTIFDIDDINSSLKKVPTIYRKIYEYKQPPVETGDEDIDTGV